MNIRLMHQDCLKAMQDLQTNSVDLLLVDLPYGVTACAWDHVLDPVQLWTHYLRIVKENGAMVFTAAQPFTTAWINTNPSLFRYELIWEKPQGTNPLNVHVMPLKCHENILVFYRKPPTYHPQMTKDTPYGGYHNSKKSLGESYGSSTKSRHRDNLEGTRYPKSILKFGQDKGFHPTQKPVALMEYIINTYSNEGDIVLDHCMGSGTTGVACVNTARNFIGIEINEKYYSCAKTRMLECNVLQRGEVCFFMD